LYFLWSNGATFLSYVEGKDIEVFSVSWDIANPFFYLSVLFEKSVILCRVLLLYALFLFPFSFSFSFPFCFSYY